MNVKKNESFGTVSIKKLLVSNSGQITLVGDVQADYLKPCAGEVEGVCRMIPWSVNETYWADANRVYLGQPKVQDEDGDWVEVAEWDNFKVPSRNALATTLFRLLKDLGEFDGEWSSRTIKRVYDITNVGTAKEPKSALVLKGKAKKADAPIVDCPFG